ncbi:MAG: hypothetical protein K0B10_08800 [Vicingaceae bacterium]|nr:hypothetical protein [Vicingaceae bacterium]
MKKITALTFGLFIAVSAFCQSELSLNVCGNSDKIAFSKLENCHSINVTEDGYKVFGFKVSYVHGNKGDTITEHKLENSELTDEVIKEIAAYKPKKIYIENANVIDVTGEAHASKPLILTVEY